MHTYINTALDVKASKVNLGRIRGNVVFENLSLLCNEAAMNLFPPARILQQYKTKLTMPPFIHFVSINWLLL